MKTLIAKYVKFHDAVHIKGKVISSLSVDHQTIKLDGPIEILMLTAVKFKYQGESKLIPLANCSELTLFEDEAEAKLITPTKVV